MRLLILAALASALASGQEFKLGSKVGDFTLTDLAGGAVPWSALRGSTTAILFISTQCPVSNDYNERMARIHADYSARGVKFLFVNANRNEPAAEVERHAKDNGFAFPVYKDSGNVLADRFGATVTPETFVLDSEGILRYRGSVDDARNPARVTSHSLRGALDAVLAGRAVKSPETKSFGCTIKRVEKKPS